MPTSDEAMIRDHIQRWSEALQQGDAEALARDYAEDVATAGLPSPLWAHDRATYVANMKNWLSGVDGQLTNEVEGLTLAVDSSVAFAYGISHTTGKFKSGDPLDMRVRLTLGFRKVDGQWKVVFDHVSVPFDMKTMRPLFELQS